MYQTVTSCIYWKRQSHKKTVIKDKLSESQVLGLTQWCHRSFSLKLSASVVDTCLQCFPHIDFTCVWEIDWPCSRYEYQAILWEFMLHPNICAELHLAGTKTCAPTFWRNDEYFGIKVVQSDYIRFLGAELQLVHVWGQRHKAALIGHFHFLRGLWRQRARGPYTAVKHAWLHTDTRLLERIDQVQLQQIIQPTRL